jgi:hypothetical protein
MSPGCWRGDAEIEFRGLRNLPRVTMRKRKFASQSGVQPLHQLPVLLSYVDQSFIRLAVLQVVVSGALVPKRVPIRVFGRPTEAKVWIEQSVAQEYILLPVPIGENVSWLTRCMRHSSHVIAAQLSHARVSTLRLSASHFDVLWRK